MTDSKNESALSTRLTNSTELLEALKKWLFVFSEHYGKPISDTSASAYKAGLEDLTLEQLNGACARTLRESRFMPTVADIRSHIQAAQKIALEDGSENAWTILMERIDRQYHPDLGWRGPQLSERMDHAARAAGGYHYLSQCAESELVWAKKRFVECWLRDEQLAEYKSLAPAPDDSERKQLRDAVRALSTSHQLPSRAEWTPPATTETSKERFPNLPVTVDFEQRKAKLLAQARQVGEGKGGGK